MANKPPRRHRRVNVATRVSHHQVLARLFRLFRGVDFVSIPSGGGAVRLTSGSNCSPGEPVRYLAEEVLSKYDDGKSSEAKLSACLDRWWKAEELCASTNQRLPTDFRGATARKGCASIVDHASRKIEWLLGEFSWDEALKGVGFGPGATTRLGRSRSDLSYKMGGIPQATLGCAGLAHAYIQREAPLWGRYLSDQFPADIVPGNRITTVPKSYKTDRAIAIEPCWNIFFQKGLGRMIRERLKRVNIDLDDQTANQRAAKLGSIDGSLATIDLSMASDTVSRAIVKRLIPPDWLDALEQLRSPMGSLPSGQLVTYQKFSSMGNGYTFELESLIFWALATATTQAHGLDARSVLVYGDDIVVPSEVAESLLEVLDFCGFVPNADKSHWTGTFRESCGKHYSRGADISPFYIRERVANLDRLFLLHNNIYRWLALPAVWKELRDLRSAQNFLRWLRGHAPKSWRQPRLPIWGFGDSAFVGTFDECSPARTSRRHAGWEGYLVKHTLQWRRRPIGTSFGSGVLLKSLWLLDRVPQDVEWTAWPDWARSWGVYPLWVSRWTQDEPIWSSSFPNWGGRVR